MFHKVLVALSLAFSIVAAKRQGGMKISNPRLFIEEDICILYPDYEFFAHENCDQYWECDEFDQLIESWCPDDKPVFDSIEFFCGNFCRFKVVNKIEFDSKLR